MAKKALQIKTNHGFFVEDGSGLWHYRHRDFGHVTSAAQDAIEHKPSVAWFWFNDTPAPMYSEDSVDVLVNRWEEWRCAYQQEDKSFFLYSLLNLGAHPAFPT